MENTDEKLQIPKFNDGPKDSFVLWQLRIRAVLETKNLLQLVDGSEIAPAEDSDATKAAEFRKRKSKAAALLVVSLGDRPLKAVQKWAKDPATLWAKLVERFASKTTSTKLMLLNEVFNVKFTASSSMTDHIADLELSFTRLAAAGQNFDDLLQVSILLSSIAGMPDFEPTVAAIRTMDKSKATWEAVCSRLIDEAKERASQLDSAGASLAFTAGSANRQSNGQSRTRRVHVEAHPRAMNQSNHRNNENRRNRNRNGNARRNNGRQNGEQHNADAQPRLATARSSDSGNCTKQRDIVRGTPDPASGAIPPHDMSVNVNDAYSHYPCSERDEITVKTLATAASTP